MDGEFVAALVLFIYLKKTEHSLY